MILNNDIRVKSNHNKWVDDIISKCDNDNLVGPTGGMVDPKDGFKFLYETEDSDKQINYLSGWCLSAKRSVFDKLILPGEFGPFDTKNFFVFYEDTDLSFRAKNLGINFVLQSIPVVHFKHQTAKELNMNQLYTDAKKVFVKKWAK